MGKGIQNSKIQSEYHDKEEKDQRQDNYMPKEQKSDYAGVGQYKDLLFGALDICEGDKVGADFSKTGQNLSEWSDNRLIGVAENVKRIPS